MALEVTRLPACRLSATSGEVSACPARAEEIPAVLREIGRLRELTFRAASEGTGKFIDLDIRLALSPSFHLE